MLRVLVAADWYLVGLGVTVTTTTYPAFHQVGPGQWRVYHAQHTTRIAWAVAPAWLVQGILCALWIIHGEQRSAAIVHGLFAALAVIATVLGAVPQHNAIQYSYNRERVRRLEAWHIARTLLWLVAAVLATYSS